MNALTPDIAAKLGACLALAEEASNPHDGERLAALHAAERLLDKHGMKLRDLVRVPGERPKGRDAPHAPWRDTVRRCQERPGGLRPWEGKFLASLAAFPRLSDKQSKILREIASRLGVS